ncbi:nonsense-mediated mRNA decay factor SMG9 [Onthophagus taurus]|uniref:nonsense-mediated mRNA decay factor SMG9 n=1 Tax=Onthophagus taurus TaxID=166361 RepID=UPI0039BE2044
MSDSNERGKFYNKKRYPNHRQSENNAFGSRCFNSKNIYKPDKDFSKDSDKGEAKPKSIKQPTLLLKAPERAEERSASPKQKDDAKSDPSQITIVTNTSHEHASHTIIKSMSKSIKLLEDGNLLSENIQDYLLENNDFLVVGFIGKQGVGKSTILNLLTSDAVCEEFKQFIFQTPKSKDEDNLESNIKILNEAFQSGFKPFNEQKDNFKAIFHQQQIEHVDGNLHTTSGIDIFITKNRMILLDCQPVLSCSILDELMRCESKRANVISEFSPLENSGEIQGLQLTAFLMSVCHVLVAVNDWFFDTNFIRFLQTAEMLKPTISNPDEDFVDYFPHLVLLQNKAQMEDFTPARFKQMQKVYKNVFSTTKMHLESGLGIGNGRIMNTLCAESSEAPINLFLLPEYNEKTEGIFKGHPPLEELISKLRAGLMSSTKYPLTHVQLSEKNWLVYSAKVWDHVKKSSFFVEYSKLMP